MACICSLCTYPSATAQMCSLQGLKGCCVRTVTLKGPPQDDHLTGMGKALCGRGNDCLYQLAL